MSDPYPVSGNRQRRVFGRHCLMHTNFHGFLRAFTAPALSRHLILWREMQRKIPVLQKSLRLFARPRLKINAATRYCARDQSNLIPVRLLDYVRIKRETSFDYALRIRSDLVEPNAALIFKRWTAIGATISARPDFRWHFSPKNKMPAQSGAVKARRNSMKLSVIKQVPPRRAADDAGNWIRNPTSDSK